MTETPTQTALITGCSGVFGRLTAQTLAARGWCVYATMRETTGRNADAARALDDAGETITVLDLDVTDGASVDAAVSDALARSGRIDVLVNNAGLSSAGMLEAFSCDELQRVIDVNLLGPFRVTRAVLPSMRTRRSGLIINVSSLIARLCVPFMAPYCATKAAMEVFSTSWSYELAAFGIETVVVVPGGYLTDIYDKALRPADAATADDYGALGAMPEMIQAGMRKMLAGPAGEDPQNVADTITGIIDTQPGKRPLRVSAGGVGSEGISDLDNMLLSAQEEMAAGIGLSRSRLAAMGR